MKELLMLEFRNCLNRREFKFIFGLLMFLSVSAFLFACFENYRQGLILIRSASDMSMLVGTGTGLLLSVELILLPLFTSIVYSDSFFSDVQSGVYKSLLTRTNARSYIWAKGIVAFVVSFFSFFLPYLVNQLLCLVAFPLRGYDNNFAFPPYDIGFQNYDTHSMFDLLRLQSPLAYNLLYMLLISLAAAMFALLTYGAYFVFKKGKFAIITGVFLLFVVIVIATGMISFKVSLINLLKPGGGGSFGELLLWLGAVLVLSIAMIAYKTSRIEVGIEK